MDRGLNNWLGVKGREDLGGGMVAVFNLQTRFKIDTGALERDQTFFQGESTVGLSDATLGTVNVGRKLSPLWATIWPYEPWFNSGFNASLASYQAGKYSSDGVTDAAIGYADYSRISNGLYYDSPVMRGWQVSVAGQVERNPDPGTRARTAGTSVTYATAPLRATLSYEHNMRNEAIWFLGGAYDLGAIKLMGSYARTSLVDYGVELMSVVAATYDIGANTWKAGYGRNVTTGAHKLSMGVSHALSKRTNVYADLYREHVNTALTGYAIGMSHAF